MLLALALLHYPIFSAAYSWNFQNTPQQCTNLSISITGSGGQSPYRVLIVPFGPSPLGNVEARKIQEFPFDTDSSVSFKLNYPANSQFVAVVSDKTGFGSGGTSVAAQVTSSSDSSCFDSSKSVSGPWTFSVNQSTVVQCEPTRLYWQDPTKVQGTPTFFGVIPGGQSFAIPSGTPDDEHNSGLGTGYSWTPSVRGGTTVILVGSDNSGTGTGGSNPFTVQNGPNNDVTCLNDQSPSSTPGNPAGGSYPTNGSGGTTGGGGSGGTNVGAIVGGVIGGVVLILAFVLVLLFLRRRDRHRHYKEKPTVDLAADDGDEAPARASRNELPQYYQPEPFVVPEPATTTTESEYDPANRLSYASSGTTDLLSASGGNSTTATSRKGGYQRHMRPVNIIQHDDAGPSEGLKEEPETIELPPAYNKIKPASEVGTPASEIAPPLATTTTASTTTAPA